MTYQVLARKWRPRSLKDVVGQPFVVQALTNAFTQQFLHHAYVYTGTRGVGKTSIARIVAKCLNCEKGISADPCQQCSNCQEIDAGRFPDLYEVDAASRTKVEETRELLENIPYAPTKGRFKVYLIDEVHMLSTHSFNALLKTLEEPPAHVKFLLATTDPQKLPPTILSRCLQFHLSHISVEQISEHLQHVLQKENISFDVTALNLIAKAANGSMRDALSLLDQSIAYGNGQVKEPEVKSLLGTIEPTSLYEILSALTEQNGNQLLAAVEKLAHQGIDFSRALSDLLGILHQIAIKQVIPEAGKEYSDNIQQLAKKISREDVQLYYQIGLLGQKDLPFAPSSRSGFEMTLLRMLAFTPETNSAKPLNHSKPTAQPSHSPVAQNLQWNDLLANLKLDGATAALAEFCSLKEIVNDQIYLVADPKHKALVQDQYIARIAQAASEYFEKSMKVSIDIGLSTLETPANFKKRQKEEKQTAAEHAVYNDETIKRLIQTFDATIIEGSITPLEKQTIN